MKKRIVLFIIVMLFLGLIPLILASSGGRDEWHSICSGGNCIQLEGGGDFKCDFYTMDPNNHPCCKQKTCINFQCIFSNYDNPTTVGAGETCPWNYKCSSDVDCNACLKPNPCPLDECKESVTCVPIDGVNKNCNYVSKPIGTPCSGGGAGTCKETTCCHKVCTNKECGMGGCGVPNECGICDYGSCNSSQQCFNLVDWTDMRGAQTNKAALNNRVKLTFSGHDLTGQKIDYEIVNKVTNLVVWTGSANAQTATQGYISWKAVPAGTYYYRAMVNGTKKTRWFSTTYNTNPDYRYLDVSATETNSAPVANITNPKRGDVNKTGEIISFNQISYDIDDFMNYSWDLGDLNIIKGSTVDYTNYNLTHSYSVDGQMNINLSVVDERGLTDQDLVSILITNPNAVGKKYVFAGIRNPKYGQTLDQIGNVAFDASDSYAVQVAAGGVLNCLGGNCPPRVTATANSGSYSMFNFSWRFDDGTNSGIISGNQIYYKGLSIGNHFAILEVSLSTGEKSNAVVIFRYQGGGSASCQNNKTEWVKDGIVYNTSLENGYCKGEDNIIGTDPATSINDDCCPRYYICEGGASNAKCVINSKCIPVRYSCGEYKDSQNCTNDKVNNCNVADKSCSSSPSTINICGEETSGGTVGGGCNCFWNASATGGGACQLNKSTSINIGTIALEGTCVVDTISAGECNEGQMIVTQNSAMKWDQTSLDNLHDYLELLSPAPSTTVATEWISQNCNLGELCFSGMRPMVCEDDSIRLDFFNWFNAFIAIIIIAIVYFIWFRDDKKK